MGWAKGARPAPPVPAPPPASPSPRRPIWTDDEQAWTDNRPAGSRQIASGQAIPDQPSPRPGEAPTKPADYRMVAVSGAQGVDAVRRQFTQALTLALAVVGVALLIAALNVANML